MSLETITWCILLILLLYVFYFHSSAIWNKYLHYGPDISSDNKDADFRVFCINLEKDTHRYETLQQSYYLSDLKHNTLERYSAIQGANMSCDKWLSPSTATEFYTVQKNGYRTHHYQLTPGGVGCFLSHYYLAKQLLADSIVDNYLILEDDIQLLPNARSIMTHALETVPPDWDLITFYTHRLHGKSVGKHFKRIDGFWGMGTYLLHKRGAQKFVDEVDQHRIDGQVDAYLSRMGQQNKLNLYAHLNHMSVNVARDTNIQNKLVPISGMNPFVYKGYVV